MNRPKYAAALLGGLVGLAFAAGTLAADRAAQPAARPAGRSSNRQAVAGTAETAARIRDVPLGALSPRNASYTIEARLDPAERILQGSEVLTWRNISPNPATELRFHLYYNAWRNTGSTWLREAALSGRRAAAARDDDDWGWIDVTAIRLVGVGSSPPIDLTGQMRFISPDDGNPLDRTVLAVSLPAPVAPGQTINVDVAWTSKIPRTFSRTGAVGNYFFIAQWFPKIGVLEERGWNCHQFHAGTEFYADYGTYDVRLTVPAGWIVGATGREREVSRDGEWDVHRYVQEDVHDFAWTTSPDFLVRTETFTEDGLPPVEMRLLLQPEHAGQEERHFRATAAALKYYGRWFGSYPYGHVTIVDPAWQSGSGGMEYPTLFTAGSRWLAPGGVTQPENVTVHECGHQFWYGIVGNNEFEHAWLDEGLNTYSTARAVSEAYPRRFYAERYFGGFIPWVFEDLPLTRESDRVESYRATAESDVPATPTFQYWPGTGSGISYSKTSLWLHTLENYLGWPTFQRVLSTFFERWKFRHPKPEDFFAVVNEVSGRDMTWFFDEVYRSSNVFDYGVQELRVSPAGVTGIGDADGGRRLVTNEPPGEFLSTVVVRRYGEAVFPVDVVVRFAGGGEVRESWDGRARWRQYTYRRPERAVSVQVDPERVLMLDVDRTNNSRSLDAEADPASTKWMLAWVGWLEDLMLTYSLFA
ncbi:MAG: M1 family metallopeptidase [Vicinamibacterales bacterium]